MHLLADYSHVGHRGEARDVSARMGEADNEPASHRIVKRDHDDWNRRGSALRGEGSLLTRRNDDVHFQANEL
jgi:hypothetical protein